MELRLLTEAGYAEEFDIIFDELMDEYSSGKLSEDERLKFKNRFLSTPERQQKLRFSMALNRCASSSRRKVDPQPKKEKSPVSSVKPTWAEQFRAFWNSQQWALRAFTALVVVAVIAGPVWYLSRQKTSPPQTFSTITLNISAGNRADGAQAIKVKLPLAANADALKISLTLPERSTPQTRHRVELENDKGETKQLEITEQDAQSVSVVIPADQLARGRYALKLYAATADGTEQRIPGSYLFNVE